MKLSQQNICDVASRLAADIDETGNKVAEYVYDLFGHIKKETKTPDGKDDNPFRYCGEYYDKEKGEVYLRARYYVPAVGRFLTRDTYTGEENEPLSQHLYTYCANDGVNAWDPSGHKNNNFTKKYKKCINKKVLNKSKVETYKYIKEKIKKGGNSHEKQHYYYI